MFASVASVASAAPSSRERLAPWVAAASVGSVCVASALIDPSGGPTICPLKAMTGIDCPLCGATRAAHHLFRGDLVTALDFNALFVIAAPLFLLIGFGVFRQVLGGRRARVPRLSRPVVVSVLLVIATFSVVRNLGIAPFQWLSSTA